LFLLVPGPRFAAAAPDNTLGISTMAAAVDAAGGLTRGSGALSAARTAVGQYRVTFDRDVSTCFTYVTRAKDSALGQGGRTTVGPFTDNRVTVRTMDGNGNEVGDAFHLLVFCPK
jgi:hypothetical protein